MASILLHCCCGPCATFPVKWLQEHDFQVTAFWYNPNIHPFMEHQRRLESMQMLAEETALPLIAAEGYEIIDYFQAVVGHEADRCADCYHLRMEKTAKVAREHGFDAFTTTLLISPYQNQKLIEEIGESEGESAGAKFFFEDFRDGFRESHRMADDLELYRQKYCGCVYSEWERYAKAKIE